ncbi:cell division protein FtsX, partial [Pseudomonas aeruginosa]
PLPPVISVTPKQIDRAGLEALRQQLAELPHVQQAQLDLVWVERLSAILKLGERFVFGLTILLVLTLLLVVGNTIRLHIENRRNEIEVIKLVGGTDGYVRRPFLYMGAGLLYTSQKTSRNDPPPGSSLAMLAGAVRRRSPP